MKRNFKEEYKNYVNNDMPDLWSRIEPALKEKEDTIPNPESEDFVDTTETGKIREYTNAENEKELSDTEKTEENSEKIEKKSLVPQKRKNRWMKYTSLAAGIVLCIIGIRIYQNSRITENGKFMEEFENSEESTDSVMEDSVVEDACKDESMADEDAAAQAPPEESGNIAATEEEITESEEAGTEESAEKPVEDSVMEDNGGKGENSQNEEDSSGPMMEAEEMELYALEEELPEKLKEQIIKKEKVAHADIASCEDVSQKWKKKGYAAKYTFSVSEKSYVVYVTEAQKQWLEQKLYDPSYVGPYTLYLSIWKEGEKESEGFFREK